MTGLLLHHVSVLIREFGSIALFVIVTAESLGAPVPGESAIVLASIAAGAGKLSIWLVALSAFCGAVLGDNVGYFLGRKFGRRLIEKYGRRIGITADKYRRAEAFAFRYGPWMVIGARFFVILRQLNGLVAGTTGMRWLAFFLANVLGAALWVGFWTTLAYKLGHSVSLLSFFWHHLSFVPLAVTIALIAGIIVLGLVFWKRKAVIR